MTDRPANDMTTDEIAADVRQRMAANPAGVATLQTVADNLAATLRDRLPHLDPTDVGAVAVNISAWLTHAQQLFTGYGMNPALVAQTSANVVAIAGTQLYGPTATAATR
jgi:hypothetical protein